MAISSTRVKFLDKENKVLVKDIKDFVSNEIFSDYVTSILDSDLVDSFIGKQNLLNLQQGIVSVSSLIDDLKVSNFSIDSILTNLKLDAPELAHLAVTISNIKSMDKKTLALFATSLIEVVGPKLMENPSLLNLYRTVTTDIKVQTLLAAIDVFAVKLAAGEVVITNFVKDLKKAGDDLINLTEINALLNAIKANNKTIDLKAIVAGDPKIGTAFLESLTALEVIEEQIDEGVIDDVNGVDTQVTVGDGVGTGGGGTGTGGASTGGGGGGTGVFEEPIVFNSNGLPISDPEVQNIFIAGVSVRRAYILAYLRNTSSIYTDENFLAYLQTPAGKDFLTYTLGGVEVYVDPVEQSSILIKALLYVFNYMPNSGLGAQALGDIFDTVTSAASNAMEILLSGTSSIIDTSFGQSTALTDIADYINTPGYDVRDTINNIVTFIKKLTATRIISSGSTERAVVGGIICYTTLQMTSHLISMSNRSIESYTALINVMQDACDPMSSFVADQSLSQMGFAPGSPLVPEAATGGHVGAMHRFRETLRYSKVISVDIRTVSADENPYYRTLRNTLAFLDSAINAAIDQPDYDSPENLQKIYDLFRLNLNALGSRSFLPYAVDLDRVAFSAGNDSILIY